MAAVGIYGEGTKHPLGVIEGATKNAAVVPGVARQSDGPRPRCRHASPVHHRRRQGVDQGYWLGKLAAQISGSFWHRATESGRLPRAKFASGGVVRLGAGR